MRDRVRAFFRMEGVGDGTPWRIFVVALGVRLLYITLAHTYKVRLAEDHFQYGWEAGRIARALATGYGYADPFTSHTGPTTWLPPLFPLLLAGVFKVFGVYTAASAWVIEAIDSVFSAGIALAVYEIAARCVDRRPGPETAARRVALWAGWIWALYPAAMQYAVHWIWDMSIATWMLAWAIVLALRMRGIGEGEDAATGAGRSRQGVGMWAASGLLWGLIALTNPSLLAFLPACWAWVVWGSRSTARSLGRSLAGAVLAACLVGLCLTPWIWRNERVMHAFVPTRGNLGAELYASTRVSNHGFPWGSTVPPSIGDPEFQRYKAMGEPAYVRMRGEEAKAWLRGHPKIFAEWTLKRAWFFWAGVPAPFGRIPAAEIVRNMNFGFLSLAGLLGLGLALRRGVPGAWLFAAAFALIPLLYYAITVQARFRHPLEPLIDVLGVYLFQSARRGRPGTTEVG